MSEPNAGSSQPQPPKTPVLARSLKHPLTVIPTLLGGAGVAAVGIFHAGLAAEILAIGGLAVGASSALINLAFRGDSFRKADLEKYAEAIREEQKRARRQLEREVELGRDVEGCQNLVDQALNQLDRLQVVRKNVESILRDKLNEGEVTFARYATSAGSILTTIETNIRAIATRFKSLKSIDTEAAKDGIRRLTRKGDLTAEDQKELKAFQDRMTLLKDEQAKIGSILKSNEEAITQLDHTVVAIAGMRTGKADATDLSGAVKDLEDLADRAKRFDVSKMTS